MEGAPVSSLVSKLRVDVKVLIKIYACIINQTPEFCKGLIKGEGVYGWFSLFTRVTRRPSGLRIKSVMTVGFAKNSKSGLSHVDHRIEKF